MKKFGFGFVEIIIATLIAAVCSIPIILMVTTSRSETTKAINYLRAVELANEALEWAVIATATNTDDLDRTLQACGGSLKTDESSIGSVAPSNAQWAANGLISRDIQYSEQYNNAFFLRTIRVTPVRNSLGADYLGEVTVEVKWNEGKTPSNPEDPDGDRMRRVTLKTLVVYDSRIDY